MNLNQADPLRLRRVKDVAVPTEGSLGREPLDESDKLLERLSFATESLGVRLLTDNPFSSH